MKKIVVDARGIQYSTGRYARKLLDYLQIIDSKNQYVVILSPADKLHWKPSADNFSVVTTKYLHGSLGEQIAYPKLLYKLKADLVHFTVPQQPIAYVKNKMTTIHDLTLTRFKSEKRHQFIAFCKLKLFKWLIGRIIRSSSAIITPSKLVRDDIISFNKSSTQKISVIYESADDISDSEQSIEALKYQKFILYVGNVFPHKNAKRLIDAFSMLENNMPDTKLVFAGKHDFYYQQIISYAKDKSNKIYFTDFVTDGELKFLYKNAICLVIPSLSEGFGLPGLEAMQYNLPVVASNATCLPEIYGDGAFYVDPLNVNDIAAAIKKITNDEALRTKLIVNGRAQLKLYSWSKTAQQTALLYDKCLK